MRREVQHWHHTLQGRELGHSLILCRSLVVSKPCFTQSAPFPGRPVQKGRTSCSTYFLLPQSVSFRRSSFTHPKISPFLLSSGSWYIVFLFGALRLIWSLSFFGVYRSPSFLQFSGRKSHSISSRFRSSCFEILLDSSSRRRGHTRPFALYISCFLRPTLYIGIQPIQYTIVSIVVSLMCKADSFFLSFASVLARQRCNRTSLDQSASIAWCGFLGKEMSLQATTT